jgi:hypothetical protein
LDHAKKIWLTTLLVGFSLFVPAWLGLFSAGSPTVICPLPALTVLPAFYLPFRALLKCVALLPTVLFFIWNPGLFEGGEEIPQRSYALFVGSILLSVIWFLMGWSYGLRYQGPQYVHFIGSINVVWCVVIGAFMLIRWKKKPSFKASIVFHWMLFAWLGWYAFPYLGELP